ncbi:hypothetical protein PPERSA_11909 [Pseudocohnilembus persalinus]|uniref:Peptidase M14 domain-containing protein n=1 Tax=Pseudocohnilembus persalinus TaxID=266149 RepID=A0A0V0QJW0_PSEPJ|nr:hypothetical protein PPERSA_11909 [Pseudocohnilembus persalinus]|eukprot:KRX02569.1 hypothetical protein PPERSA_11909 [Pseudocohnilembus persalinus]
MFTEFQFQIAYDFQIQNITQESRNLTNSSQKLPNIQQQQQQFLQQSQQNKYQQAKEKSFNKQQIEFYFCNKNYSIIYEKFQQDIYKKKNTQFNVVQIPLSDIDKLKTDNQNNSVGQEIESESENSLILENQKLPDITNRQNNDQKLNKQDNIYFSSNFESGNLAKVSQVDQNEYALLLQNDINTQGCTQWFFFKVQNKNKTGKVVFNILNFRKKKSLYQQGMKISVFSLNSQKNNKISWFRGGENIYYFKNIIQRPKKQNLRINNSFNNLSNHFYYTLSFQYDFKTENDETYFAFSQPYTYSELQQYLQMNINMRQYSFYVKRSAICRSLLGNRVEMIVISDRENLQDTDNTKSNDTTPKQENNGVNDIKLNSDKINSNIKQQNCNEASEQISKQNKEQTEQTQNTNSKQNEPIDTNKKNSKKVKNEGDEQNMSYNQKKRIIISARTHAGESVSSFIVQGIINFLLSDDEQARLLRKCYIFTIFPMVNPDGVILGNNRVSISGRDLNRRWKKPSKSEN